MSDTNTPNGTESLLIDDAVTRALLPRVTAVASRLRKAADENCSFVVRFDGDADGISSALCIVEALEGVTGDPKRVRNVQSESPIYSEGEATVDLSGSQFSETPVVFVFLDCAGNEASLPALQKLKDAGRAVFVIDHHPTNAAALDALVDGLVDPFAEKDVGSEYPTALWAYEVARRLHPPIAGKAEAYAWWGLQGDKSPFSKKDVTFLEPVVVDYLSAHNDAAASLGKYRRHLRDALDVKRLYEEAVEKIEEALARVLAKAKIKPSRGITLCVIKYGMVRSKWPSKSKTINAAHEHFDATLGGAVVTVGYANDRLSFRANRAAFERGFRANEFIAALKAEFPQGVISGGGHDVAASMKLDPDCTHAVVERLQALFSQRFDAPAAP